MQKNSDFFKSRKVFEGIRSAFIYRFIGTMSRRGGGRPMPRGVVLSKALSHLLRHSAERENLKISKEGYVNVADLVRETVRSFPY